MAVTIISNPPVSPFIFSASMGAKIEMTSDKWGTAGVTQFRYVAVINSTSPLGTKYTVPTGLFPSYGEFDVSELFKTALQLSNLRFGTSANLTAQNGPYQNYEEPVRTFTVQIKEQYYLSGVFTTNTGATLTFKAARGFTDKSNDEWFYRNWINWNGLSNFMPFSGNYPVIYPIPIEYSGWPSPSVDGWMQIKVIRRYDGFPMWDNTFQRGSTGKSGVVYQKINSAATVNNPLFTGVNVEIYTGTLGFMFLRATYLIDQTVDQCEGDDPEMVVMFQDRFFQWAFMSFKKISTTTINAIPQRAEAIDGRFRYNIKSSDTLNLNTDWLDDNQNDLIRDLVVSPQCYLVDSSGGNTALTVVPNSLRLQTTRADGLHQYQMSFQQSVDNFKP